MSEDLNFESQLQFKDAKFSLVSDHSEYLKEHPEVKNVMSDFLSECLLNKPDNVYAFAREHFSFLASSNMPTFIPTVITGPSGVGKGTLIERLMNEFPDTFGFSVSHTTRSPRPEDIPGFHYHFVTMEEMKQAIANNEFIEHANVHGNLYGTSKKAVESVVRLGKICIMDIDVQGCESVKKSGMLCRYIFIAPPSLEELTRRLVGRNTETIEKIEIRLANAKKELEYTDKKGFFDHTLINDNLDNTYNELKTILLSDINKRNETLFGN